MRKKSILFLLIVAGICNALIAQNLVTKYEYYDYYQSQLKEKYTMLVDGTRHGKSYHYREEGPLWKVEDWNHGDLTTETTYYLDGKTIKTHTTYPSEGQQFNFLGLLPHPTNHIVYDTKGHATHYFSIKYAPNKRFLTSFYDEDNEIWKFSFSSDKSIIDIKNIETGAHFTYDNNKEELKINNLETILFGDSIINLTDQKFFIKKIESTNKELVKQKIKNNIVTYEILQDVEFISNGYVYQLPKGLTGQYTIKNIPLPGIDFLNSFFFYDITQKLLYPDIFTPKLYPRDPMANQKHKLQGLQIPLPTNEVLKQGKVVGIQLRDDDSYAEASILLKLISGDYQNGVFEFKEKSNYYNKRNTVWQITTHDGKIVKYNKEYKTEYDEWNLEATKIKTSYDENNKCIALEVLEGSLTETNWKGVLDVYYNVYVDGTLFYDEDNDDTKTNLEKVRYRDYDIEAVYEDKTKVGKFETKEDKKPIEYKFIEGEITYNYYDYDCKKNYSCHIISTKNSKKVETGKFENDSLIEGKRVIIDKNGEETTYEGKFHNGKFIQGEMKSNGVSMVGSFENGVFVNGTKTLTFNDGNTYILKGNFTENGWLKNGQIDCSGNLSFYIQKPFEFKKMTCTLPSCEVYIEKKNGDVFEGIIPEDILRKFLWRYITAQENPNTTVKGKYTKSDGNILEGTFRNIDILNKDLNVRMLLSGTANFATNFGHYIGGYANGKAIGAGKVIVNDLGEFIGHFENDKLSKDSICTINLKFPNGDTFKGYMLGGKISGYGELRFANGDYYIGEFVEGKFSGTGNVRYTHKKGVYEGKVDNFVCQYDTTQDKKALKKVKSPKVPKIQIPSKVGKMSVTTPE